MEESIFAEDLINVATLSGWWEECDSNVGELQQVACACYPAASASGNGCLWCERGVVCHVLLILEAATFLQHVDTQIVPVHSLSWQLYPKK
eukprot:363033-Chlamydomonas_euryale.AAC.2